MKSLISDSYNFLKFFNRIVNLKGLIWGIFGGFAIGIVISYYHKSFLGELPRRLIKKGASSPESALTLKEVGLKPGRLLTGALKNGKTLRHCVSIANEEECEIRTDKPEKKSFLSSFFPERKKFEYDFENMKLFVSEENKYLAEVKYEQKKRHSPVWLIVWIAALAALAVAVTIAVPDLLHLLDNFLEANLGGN